MIPTAILIHGRKGVGKDTLATHLHYQHGYVLTSLADPLKRLLVDANPPMWIEGRETRLVEVLQDCEGWDEAKRRHPAVRELLKGIGQGARNVFGETFWLEEYILRLNDFRDRHPLARHFIVSDIRYENELRTLKEHFGPGARSVKLVRSGHEADGHPSEDGLPDDQFDMVLENNASLGDLFAKMRLMFEIWNTESMGVFAA